MNSREFIPDISNLIDTSWQIFLPESCKPPLVSIISKTTELRLRFLDATGPVSTMGIAEFPFKVKDSRIAGRAIELLNKAYMVKGKSVNDWIKWFKIIIKDGKNGEKKFLNIIQPGSSSHYTTGLPLLKYCLNKFYDRIPLSDYAKISGKILNMELDFSDVDIKIQVNASKTLYDIKAEIENEADCKILYNDKNILIVRIGKENEPQIDFTFYNIEGVSFAFYGDDFGIDLNNSDFDNNITALVSKNPWSFWRSKVLKIAENEGGREDFRLFLRLLGKESKGEVCIDSLEKDLFLKWIKKSGNIKDQFNKEWKDHDSKVPIARYLLSLRAQQVILEQSPGNTDLLMQASIIDTIKDLSDIPPFIIHLFKAMQEKGANIEALHGLLECIAIMYMCEGNEKWFQVKLVKHGLNKSNEPEWVMRMRFRGKFGKRDLLIKFKPQKSLAALKKLSQNHLREILHSLWKEEFGFRELTEDYKKSLFHHDLDMKTQASIRKELLGTDRNVFFSEQISLADLEINTCNDPKAMLILGDFIFNFYEYDPILRDNLCWKVVNKCIEYKWSFHGAEMIHKMRKANRHPEEGYTAFFVRTLNSGCNESILKACSPFILEDEQKWYDLIKNPSRENLAKICDGAHVPAELFLDMIRISDMKKQSMSEGMLCSIIKNNGVEVCAWIEKMDKPGFITDDYKKSLSGIILQNLYDFSHNWLLEFLKTCRFEGEMEQKIQLCSYMISTQIPVLEKADLLDKFKINDTKLWHDIASECISQGEILPKQLEVLEDIGSKAIVSCFKIIDRADEGALKDLREIEGTLDKQLRGSMLIRLLKNWKNKKASAELLEFFDTSKKDWKWADLIEGIYDAESLLKVLKGKSLNIYSSLFRVLEPDSGPYSKWWVEEIMENSKKLTLDKTLGILEQPKIRDCLRIAQKELSPIITKIMKSERGQSLIIDILDNVSQDLLYKLMDEAILFDDTKTASRLFLKYHVNAKCKNNNTYKLNLLKLAHRHLFMKDGNIKITAAIWEFIQNFSLPKELPPSANLIKLIHNGHSEWVISMIKENKNNELIGADLYNLLLRKVKEPLSRRNILLLCKVHSDPIRRVWEQTILDRELSPSELISLISCSPILQLPTTTVARCAVHVLSKYKKIHEDINNDIVQILINTMSNIDLPNAYELWEALRKSNKVNVKILWEAGCSLLKRDLTSPKHTFIKWLIDKAPKNTHEILLPILEQIAENVLDETATDSICTYVKPLALKQNITAQKIYWKLDYDKIVTPEELDLLKPTPAYYQKLLFQLVQVAAKHKPDKTHVRLIHKAWMSYISSDYNELFVKEVLILLVDNHLALELDQIYKILEFVNRTKMQIKNISEIIIALTIAKQDEKYFGAVLDYLESSIDTPLFAPVTVIRAFSFPIFENKVKAFIDKVQDEKRRAYLNAFFLYAQSVANPTPETMCDFMDSLGHIWVYLKENGEGEYGAWRYITDYLKVPEICPKADIYAYFYGFIVEVMGHKCFCNLKVITKFLNIINNHNNNFEFHLFLLFNLADNKLIRTDFGIIEELVNFTMHRIPFSTTIASSRKFLSRLYLAIGALILNNEASQVAWSSICSVRIKQIANSLPNEKVPDFEMLDGMHLALTRKISEVLCKKETLPLSSTIVLSIKTLCDSYNPHNLSRAMELLLLGTRKVLYKNPDALKIANNFILSCGVNNQELKSESEFTRFFRSFFMHLSKEAFINKLDRYDIIKENLLDLIILNVNVLCDAFPKKFHLILDFLNTELQKLSPNFYSERPDFLPKILPKLMVIIGENYETRENDERVEKWKIVEDKMNFLICIHTDLTKFEFTVIDNPNSHGDYKKTAKDYQKTLNCINKHDELIKIKPTKLTLGHPTIDLIKNYRWCQKMINFCIKSRDDKVQMYLLENLKSNFIDCLHLCTFVSLGESLIPKLAQDLEKILRRSFISTAKLNPDFANQWFKEFIVEYMKGLKNKDLVEYYQDVNKQICEALTTKLLPSLPEVVQLLQVCDYFEGKTSPIEAYYALISNGCEDDNIFKLALENAHELCFEFGSKTNTDPSRFRIRFEIIYFEALKRVLNKFKEVNNAKEYDENLTNFVKLTSQNVNSLKGLDPVTKYKIVNLFCMEKALMSDSHFCLTSMQFLSYLINGGDQPVREADIALTSIVQITFLHLSILCGPLQPPSGKESFYINSEVIDSIEVKYLFVNHPKFLDKWFLLAEKPEEGNNDMLKMLHPLRKEEFIISMKESIVVFLSYKKIRPEFNEWFEYWIARAQFLIKFASKEPIA